MRLYGKPRRALAGNIAKRWRTSGLPAWRKYTLRTCIRLEKIPESRSGDHPHGAHRPPIRLIFFGRRAIGPAFGEILILWLAIAATIRAAAQQKPAAITTFCTNLRAAHLVEALEAETGILVYDTISTVVWKSLRLAGVDTRELRGWGRLFAEVV